VAIISKLYPPYVGGMERHAALLAEYLPAVDPQIDVQVITGQPQPRRFEVGTWNGVTVHRATTIAYVFSTPVTLGLSRLLKETNADLYHFHIPYPWGEWIALTTRLSSPVIVTFHHEMIRPKGLVAPYRLLLQAFLRQVNRIVVWSPQLRRESRTLQPFTEKTVVIPGGIDTARFAPTESMCHRAARLKRRLAGSQPMVLFVGRLVYYKGIEYLIRAMRTTSAKLVIVGKGPLRSELGNVSESAGVRDQIVFVGEIPDEELPAYYLASDVVALPSSSSTEAFGLVQLEAHASETPVVNTELNTGVNFVNRPMQTGMTVPPRNAKALSDALNSLLGDAPLRRRLGHQARQRARRLFDMKVCAKATADLYRSVLSEQSKPLF